MASGGGGGGFSISSWLTPELMCQLIIKSTIELMIELMFN
jgi:hypothetical protein